MRRSTLHDDGGVVPCPSSTCVLPVVVAGLQAGLGEVCGGLSGRLVASDVAGQWAVVAEDEAQVEQALVDAEVVRAQAELTRAEAQVTYDAARLTLASSEVGLVAASRAVEDLREMLGGDAGQR